MTYTLYNRLGSAGLVVEAALSYGDIRFERVEIESTAGDPIPDSFRDVNPWGQVPVLVLPDGETLTEAAAILTWLLAAHPRSGLGPKPGAPGYGQFVRWVVYTSVNVHESTSRQIYPFRFTTDPAGEGAVSEAARQRKLQSLEVLDAAIAPGPFLLGDILSAADMYFAMFYMWNKATLEPTGATPHLAAIYQRVLSEPKLADIYRRHNTKGE